MFTAGAGGCCQATWGEGAGVIDMCKIESLTELPLSWWVRKCLRSKRLTRWFLRSESFSIRSLSSHAAGMGVDVEEWVPPTNLLNKPVRVLVGDAGILQRVCPPDTMHPAVEHRVLRDVGLRSLSDLIYAGSTVLVHHMVQIATDKLPEECRPGVKVDVSKGTLSFPCLKNRAHQLSEAVSLLDATAPNYAHWLTEILPKAVAWARYGGDPTVPLLVDAGLHPNIIRALELSVPSEQQILLVPARQLIHVRSLHHLSAPGHIPYEPRDRDGLQRSHGTFSTAALSATVETIKSALGLRPDDPQDQVLFIRRNSGARNVLNQPELDALVAQQGWTVVAPETLTFDEQVRLFHRARMVVGPTGAAMANLIFARPGCRIGVMMSTHPATPYFYWQRLAEGLGVEVEYILCEPEAGFPHGVHSNFTAPVADMARAYKADRLPQLA